MKAKKRAARAKRGFTVTGRALIKMLRARFGASFDNPHSNGYFYQAVRLLLMRSRYGGRFGAAQVIDIPGSRKSFLDRVDESWRTLAA